MLLSALVQSQYQATLGLSTAFIRSEPVSIGPQATKRPVNGQIDPKPVGLGKFGQFMDRERIEW